MQWEGYSPDGRWWWDGATWRPVAPPGRPPGLFWFVRSPRWAGPFFLTGCILLLPIVGQMVLLGWYLATRDSLRAGWWVLPRAGFHHLERGVAPVIAGLVYFLYLVPVYVLLVAATVVAVVAHSAVAIALAIVVLLLFALASTVTLGFLSAALYDVADAQGIGAAIDPRRLWVAATADAGTSWLVYGTFLLGSLAFAAISIISLPILAFIPFGSLLPNVLMPAIYLLAAPAQADFNRR
jgi:hypothetical protein